MAYERFYQALEGYEQGKDSNDLLGHALELFDELFQHCPRSYDWITEDLLEEAPRIVFEEAKKQLEALGRIEWRHSEDSLRVFKKQGLNIHQAWRPVNDSGFRLEHIGSIGISTGIPNPLPYSDMLDRLNQLDLPGPSYQPDEGASNKEVTLAMNQGDYRLFVEHGTHVEKLVRSIYVKSAILFTTWLLSGYGDDIQPTHRQLERLLARFDIARFDDDGPVSMPQVRSLSERVAAELARQQGDYVEALTRMANSIAPLCHVDTYATKVVAPWLSDARAQTRTYIENIEQLPNGDWLRVEKTCELLSKCFFDPSDNQGVYGIDDFEETEHTFWMQKTGWALGRLTPDQLREYQKTLENDASVQRLQTYFFADGLWQKLSVNARNHLQEADLIFVRNSGHLRS